MGIRIYTGNRLESLVSELADRIASTKESIFDADIIVVQSKGMERWLKLQLASKIGICGNIKCPFPKNVINDEPSTNPNLDASFTINSHSHAH